MKFFARDKINAVMYFSQNIDIDKFNHIDYLIPTGIRRDIILGDIFGGFISVHILNIQYDALKFANLWISHNLFLGTV